MKLSPISVLLLLCGALIPEDSTAQSDTTRRRDSLRVYNMGEITVADEREREIQTATIRQIPLSRIRRSDVSTAEQLAFQIPAGQVRTNSRGESLIFLRGVGERQVAIFLDGALMNIPWDNRIDLSMLPLNSIGAISVTKGVPSILYGANVTGGAVNFITQERHEQGVLSDVGLHAGQSGYLSGYYTNLGTFGDFRYAASLSYSQRDGYAIPSNAETPYGQVGDKIRTNTDQKLMNGYLRGEYHLTEATTLGLAFNYISGEKGIASEAHLPAGDARYWRYPDYSNFHTILNLRSSLTDEDDWVLRGALWFNQFQQSIDQYIDSTYTTRDATEKDDDVTLGTRFTLLKKFGENSLNLTVNALNSTHDQIDYGYDSTGLAGTAPTMSYQQNLASAGVEYQAYLSNALKATAGVTFDLMTTPKTGDKTIVDENKSFSDYSAILGLGYALDDHLSLRANVGRKTRFPTMRELYGEALRRFILNPELKAEVSQIVEAGVTGSFDWGTLDLTGFGYFTDRTIERIDTAVGDKTFRKRVNLAGSTTPGVELTTFVTEFRPLTLEASLTWMQPRTTTDNADGNRYLSERPELIAFATLDYNFHWGLQPTIEISHNKPGYSLGEDGFVELPSYTILNARLAYRFFVDAISAQVFVRANNLTDANPMNQLGLPGIGREIQGGIKVIF